MKQIIAEYLIEKGYANSYYKVVPGELLFDFMRWCAMKHPDIFGKEPKHGL